MTIEDATRLLRQPQKHYAGSRLQMARTIIDSDINEGVVAESDQQRAALLHIVGPAASPDQGFYPDLAPGAVLTAKGVRFGSLAPTSVLDFALKPGSFYVGGRRFEQLSREPVIFQRAYLQMGPSTAPRANVGRYRQIAILRAWEQPVTAVEDAELVEAALGGADSTVRMRSTCRVEIHEVNSTACASAFSEIIDDLTEHGSLSYDATSSELRSNARLQLGFVRAGTEVDCAACTPSLRGRYLGSEPHTIRIMLTAFDRYVWAFDNAAPLYRVRLTLDGGGGGKVEFLTPPKDSYHEPDIDTVVELLPWSVLLDPLQTDPGALGTHSPTEKIASRTGILAEVDEPYSAGARSMHVRLSAFDLARLGNTASKDPKAKIPVKSGANSLGDVFATRWDSRHPQADQLNVSDANSATHLYLRIWHKKRSGADTSIPVAASEPLGDTGIVPKFTGKGRAGDYWIATVRPSAPEEILPLEMMNAGGTPPAGPTEVIAPLCLLEWQSDRGVRHTLNSIQDCAPRLAALTERRCCTYVVGPDGRGDFPTIQAALDALPRQGGRVCVLAGTYDEALVIRDRVDVIVQGCGNLARLEPGTPSERATSSAPVIRVEGEGTAVLREFMISARGRVGVEVVGTRVRIENVTVLASSLVDQPAQSAIQVLDAEEVRVACCHLVMDAKFTDHALVYVSGTRVDIEGNVIECQVDDNGEIHAWGGIQIAGGSREVCIRGNRIEHGRGHGITLGSVRFRGRDGTVLPPRGAGAGQSDPKSPTVVTGQIVPILLGATAGSGTPLFPDPDEAIEDLEISDNRIIGMGASGIGSLAVEVHHQGEAVRPPLCIRRTTFDLVRVSIHHNDISQNELAATEIHGSRPLGAVVLSHASALRFADNSVQENAIRSMSPVSGVFIAGGERITVSGNRIRRNGRPLRDPGVGEGNANPVPGGLVLGRPALAAEKQIDFGKLIEVATVRDNVIDQPNGAALAMFCSGCCVVSSNFLSVRNPSARSVVSGAAVHVFHRERPWEALELPQGEPNPSRWAQPRGSVGYLRNGLWKEFGDALPGGIRVSSNQVITTSGVPLRVPPVVLLSSDDIVVQSNQFSARIPGNGPWTHVLAMGATLNMTRNRVSDRVSVMPVSLTAVGLLMMVTAENLTTHCTVAYCPNNQGNPQYYQNEDNLIWFTPVEGSCAKLAGRLLKPLGALIEEFFGIEGISFRFREEFI